VLQLKVVIEEGFDDETQRFIDAESVTLELEHSLLSLSKWESKHEISFLSGKDMTDEQVRDYVHMMNSSGEIPPVVFSHMNAGHFEKINEYINAKMSATTFRETGQQRNIEVVTAELIYYWMIALDIPFECERWHLNRLTTLIKICNIKNAPKDKQQSAGITKDVISDRRALNEQRRREMGTSG
jgi:hypothetical protein